MSDHAPPGSPDGTVERPGRQPSWTLPVAMVGLVILPVTGCLACLIGSNWFFARQRVYFEQIVIDEYGRHPVMARKLGGIDQARFDSDRSRLVQTEQGNDRLAVFLVTGPLGEGELTVDLAAPPFGPEPKVTYPPTATLFDETFNLSSGPGPRAGAADSPASAETDQSDLSDTDDAP